MKFLFFLFFLISLDTSAQSSFYKLSLSTSADSISMQQFMGQRVLIACAPPDSLTADGIHYFDSLQQAFSDLQVIIMPVMDMGGDSNEVVLGRLQSEQVSFLWSGAAISSSLDSAAQDPVIRWLTRLETNTHFNVTIMPSQVFVISPFGDLYAVLNNGFRDQVLTDILQQEIQ